MIPRKPPLYCYNAGAIPRSLRFRASNTAFLNRTFSTPTNRDVWTYSTWFKRSGNFATNYVCLFSANPSGTGDYWRFNSTDSLEWAVAGASGNINTTAYRDPTSWYHLVISYNKTAGYITFYINGNPISKTAVSGTSNINSNIAHYIGKEIYANTQYFEGYLAETIFVDGQALAPTSFGKKEARSGKWIPNTYTGTYGINGFYLPFNDPTSTVTIGYDRQLGLTDSSKNNWSSTGISITPGLTMDSVFDSPSNNYATLNPTDIISATYASFSEGAMSVSFGTGAGAVTYATQAIGRQKIYFEVKPNSLAAGANNGFTVGVSYGRPTSGDHYTKAIGYLSYDGNKTVLGTNTAFSASYTTTDVIGVVVDGTIGTVEFFKNGVSQGTLGNALLTTADFYPVILNNSSTGGSTASINFGQRGFSYPAPYSDCKTLCTRNITPPTIRKDSPYFKALSYLGNGASLRLGNGYGTNPNPSYEVSKSLRFDSGGAATLLKTFAGAGLSRKKWTFACWIKRSKVGEYFQVWVGYNGGATDYAYIYIDNTDKVYWSYNSTTGAVQTTRKILDTEWHHYVFHMDTDNATAALRYRIFIDGVEETAFDTDNRASLSGWVSSINAGVIHAIGCAYNGTGPANGYMADVWFVDNQLVMPSDFGQQDYAYETWVPKAYTGPALLGNSFHLDFSNTSSVAALGNDVSGLGNNFTPGAGFSVTTDSDSLGDLPTVQYPVMSPTNKTGANTSISKGGLTITKATASTQETTFSSFPMSGKVYWEVSPTAYTNVYLCFGDGSIKNGGSGYIPDKAIWWSGAGIISNAALTTIGNATYTTTDVLGFAIDTAGNTAYFYKNGTLVFTVTNMYENLGLPFGTPLLANCTHDGTSNSATVKFNFGQKAFTYTPPAGFVAANTKNLPYDQTLGNYDLAIIKDRSASTSVFVADTIRGVSKTIATSDQAAQATNINGILRPLRGGVVIGGGTGFNTSSNRHSTYLFKKDITAGFDIVTWNGNSTAGTTIPHALGKTPAFIMIKNLTTAATDWCIWHQGAGTGYFLTMQSAIKSNATAHFNGVLPSSSAITLGSSANVNATGAQYVAYIWAEIPGYSKVGTYTGNLSADGP